MKVEAEIEKIKAETRNIDIDTSIRQAESLISMLEKYQKLGVKIQIDDDLLIGYNSNGFLSLKLPKELE